MKQVEVYFDYMCPYCYKGHQNLLKLLPDHPDVEILWKPCEAHPRPEVRDRYTDVAMMGMFYLRDTSGSVEHYNDLVYDAHFNQHQPIDDPDVLAGIAVQCGADADAFRLALADGRYTDEVMQANIRAWGDMEWEAVPSYACGDKKLGSRGGVLVSAEALNDFLATC